MAGKLDVPHYPPQIVNIVWDKKRKLLMVMGPLGKKLKRDPPHGSPQTKNSGTISANLARVVLRHFETVYDGI